MKTPTVDGFTYIKGTFISSKGHFYRFSISSKNEVCREFMNIIIVMIKKDTVKILERISVYIYAEIGKQTQ